MKKNTSDRAVCIHFNPASQECEECSKNTRSVVSERYLQMLSMLDGAKTIVELYQPAEGYSTGWKERWLEKVNELLEEYETNNNNSYEQRRTREP